MSAVQYDPDGSGVDPSSTDAPTGDVNSGQDHLLVPSLRIRGFFGINELDIPRLGRVTLLVGKNSTGKSTVLDAVEVLASRGRQQILEEILYRRSELYGVPDDRQGRGVRGGENEMRPAWRSIFYGRQPDFGSQIDIGPDNATKDLRLELIANMPGFLPSASKIDVPEDFQHIPYMGVKFGTFAEIWPVDPASIWIDEEHVPNVGLPYRMRHRSANGGRSEAEPLRSVRVGPDVVEDDQSTAMWDAIALEPAADLVVRVLGIPFGAAIDGIAAIEGFAYSPHQSTRSRRRLFASHRGANGRVPLRSLGDGVLRFFQAAAGMCVSRGGILLVDEVENGIHHGVLQDYWRMVFGLARDYGVQVFATTHSWDCVRYFATAAIEDNDSEGILHRMEQHDDRHRVVEYTEEDLEVVARHRIEVR
ncbi:AAA family ATPase [Candidatus Poriferisodalis sp.]|uniref:AAA family ATPase n=1 Tax=Candidatus Poriferisodalis sp. TaxID=3101277 RepID=UPI003B0143D5